MASKQDVFEVQREREIEKIKRQGKIEGWNDYIGFWTSKALGAVGTSAGGLELLDPSIIAATLPYPSVVAGVGVALLTGRSIVRLLAKIEEPKST